MTQGEDRTVTTADKAALLAPRNAGTPHGMRETDVEVEGFGTVRVRALNRFEVMTMNQLDDPVEREAHMIAAGLVEPAMTLREVETWQKVSDAGELEPVTLAIAELSRMLKGSPKSGGETVRRRARR